MKERYTLAQTLAFLNELKQEAQAKFSTLDPKQINWKPDTKSWSVGQVLDHLIVSNGLYDGMLQGLAKGTYRAGWGAKIPFLRNFFGSYLVSGLQPGKVGNMPAPKPFQPTSSQVPAEILRRFIASQDKLIGYLQALDKLDPATTYVTSPAGSFIGYSLADLYTILVVHERRHFLQAERIIRTLGFPSV